MKITGAEFQEWHDTAWPEELIWADEALLPDGRDLYTKDGCIDLEPSEIFIVPAEWSAIPESDPRADGKTIRSLISKWRKDKSTVTLVILMPREREGEIRTYLEEQKLKVLA